VPKNHKKKSLKTFKVWEKSRYKNLKNSIFYAFFYAPKAACWQQHLFDDAFTHMAFGNLCCCYLSFQQQQYQKSLIAF
jgi:hypothetical protein